MLDVDKIGHNPYELANDKVLFRIGEVGSLRLLDINSLLQMGFNKSDILTFMSVYYWQQKWEGLTNEIIIENSIPVDEEKLIEWIETSAGARKSYKEVNAEKTETVSKL